MPRGSGPRLIFHFFGAMPPEVATFERYSRPTFPVRSFSVLTASREATLNAAL